MKPNNRHAGIDLLRVIAMLMVVYLHTVYPFTLRTDFFATKAWFIFEPLAALSRCSLALFFIISGYLVVHKNRSVSGNLKVTFWRILVPFLFFSAVIPFFLAWRTGESVSVILKSSYSPFNPTRFPENWLWFLEVLLVLYLLNPLWQAVFNDKERKAAAVYLTGLAFLFTAIVPLVKAVSGALFLFNRYTTWTGFVFFYLYGALVKGEGGKRGNNARYVFLFIFGLVLEIAGSYVSVMQNVLRHPFTFAGYFADDMGLPSLFMAVGLFRLFLNAEYFSVFAKNTTLLAHRLLKNLAGLSYGVYLIHEFIPQTISGVFRMSIDSAHMNIYLYNIGLFAVTALGAILITFILSRIPKLRMIVGITA